MVKRDIALVGIHADMIDFLGEPPPELDVPGIGWGPDGPMWVEFGEHVPARAVMLHPTISDPPEPLHLDDEWLYVAIPPEDE